MTEEIEVKIKLTLGNNLVRDLEYLSESRGIPIDVLIIEILKEAINESE